MKISSVISLLFVSVILINVSCKKDAAVNNVVPDPTDTTHPVTGTPVLLKKLYYIDTALPAPRDTIYRFSMSYDASNRLILLARLQTDSLTGDSVEYKLTYYNYNGNDTFAYRTIGYDKDFTSPGSEDRDTTYFSFSNNQHISDSTRQWGYRYVVNDYSYSPGIIRLTQDIYREGSLHHDWHNTSNIYQTVVNNDIAYQLDTVKSDPLVVPVNKLYDRFERTINHISNPNPMYRTALVNFNNYLHDDEYMPGGNYEPQHLTSQDISSLLTWDDNGTTSGAYNSQIDYTYEFRADGYPSVGRFSSVFSDLGSPTITLHYKILYQYNQ